MNLETFQNNRKGFIRDGFSLDIDNQLEVLSLIADGIAYQLNVELFSGKIDVKSGEK